MLGSTPGLGKIDVIENACCFHHPSILNLPSPTIFTKTMLNFSRLLVFLYCFSSLSSALRVPSFQAPLAQDLPSTSDNTISLELFNDLEELSRIVDISYCVGITGPGIQKPFLCASRCQDFPSFDLVTVGTSLLPYSAYTDHHE